TREEAIARMRRALDEYRIEGVRTTIPFHRRVVRHPAFLAGDLDTSFIERHRGELIPSAGPQPAATMDGPNGRPLSTREVAVIAAAIAAHRRAESATAGPSFTVSNEGREGDGAAPRRTAWGPR